MPNVLVKMKSRVNLSLAILTVLFSINSAFAQQLDVRSWTAAFLNAYTRADSAMVLRSIDENTVIYGSDLAEVFRGPAGVKLMLSNDARLWGGKAHIGKMTDVSTAHAGNFYTIFFNAPFTVGDRPSLPVRFCMVWRKSGAGWHLVQSSNGVVSEGQSAQAILTGKSQ